MYQEVLGVPLFGSQQIIVLLSTQHHSLKAQQSCCKSKVESADTRMLLDSARHIRASSLLYNSLFTLIILSRVSDLILLRKTCSWSRYREIDGHCRMSFRAMAMMEQTYLNALPSWWQKIDQDPKWQEYSFLALAIAYGLIALVAIVQLIRIQQRVPEYGWTTQKVFHLLNAFVSLLRCVVFALHTKVSVALKICIQMRHVSPAQQNLKFEKNLASLCSDTAPSWGR